MKRIFLVWLAAALCAASLSACGSPPNVSGVPDRVAELVVLDYFDEHEMEKEDYNSYSFEITHDYDRGSNSDAAVINLRIEYNYASEYMSIPVWYTYDRASGLWSLTRQGGWSEPTVDFYGDMLTGDWHFERSENEQSATIEIQSVENNAARIEYFIFAEPSTNGNHSDYMAMVVQGEGVFSIENDAYLNIEFDLPDGFYVEGRFGKKEYTETLHVYVDYQRGCDSSLGVYPKRE